MGQRAPAEQDSKGPVIRPIVYTLAVSAAINTLTMVSLDRALLCEGRRVELVQNQKLLKSQANNFPFEFIESPPVLSKKPEQTKKISNRDSVSRDRAVNKNGADSVPQMKTQGPADQLTQVQAKPSQTTSAASKAQPEIKKMEAPQAVETPKKETKLEPQTTPNAREQEKRADHVGQSGQKTPPSLDRITTQGMTRVKSSGASLSGATSFDAMGSDMGVYMKNLKERIWLAWFPYLSFQYPNDFHAADTVISLTLDAKGEVKMVKVLESYGAPVFATFCVEAVQRASGFGAVPKEILALLGKDQLEIKFAFHYR